MPAAAEDVVIVGAGIGGLAAAALLAARGLKVTVVERQATPGGKARQVEVAGARIDAGPTVFTLKRVFEELFDDCGATLADEVALSEVSTLARHSWPAGSRLDLHRDPAQSFDAIARFAGRPEAEAYRRFAAEAARIWTTLEASFLRRQKTGPIGLTMRLGLHRLGELQAVRPYESLWRALGGHFRDPRLVQLFARYATYCGCSPLRAPATLMLIAHVEAAGVWRVDGGLFQVATVLARLAMRQGALIRYATPATSILVERGRAAGVQLADGEQLRSAHVIANADPAALAAGQFGAAARATARPTAPSQRSLSALTWMALADTGDAPLSHHNVAFSGDYPREFRDIEAGRLPTDPSVYLCALDRSESDTPTGPERLQIIVNAPARADCAPLSPKEIEQCETAMLTSLRSSGLSLRLQPGRHVSVTPTDYASLFPSTGGALYGRASHGWAGSFLRPGSRTRIPGLYLAGGATHPGAGVPMAALSGRLASEALLQDLARAKVSAPARASMSPSAPAATPGGMSTPSPTMAASASPLSPSSARSSRPIIWPPASSARTTMWR
jgi:1-hydroxycarotenoid 3,4-desaturase